MQALVKPPQHTPASPLPYNVQVAHKSGYAFAEDGDAALAQAVLLLTHLESPEAARRSGVLQRLLAAGYAAELLPGPSTGAAPPCVCACVRLPPCSAGSPHKPRRCAACGHAAAAAGRGLCLGAAAGTRHRCPQCTCLRPLATVPRSCTAHAHRLRGTRVMPGLHVCPCTAAVSPEF